MAGMYGNALAVATDISEILRPSYLGGQRLDRSRLSQCSSAVALSTLGDRDLAVQPDTTRTTSALEHGSSSAGCSAAAGTGGDGCLLADPRPRVFCSDRAKIALCRPSSLKMTACHIARSWRSKQS